MRKIKRRVTKSDLDELTVEVRRLRAELDQVRYEQAANHLWVEATGKKLFFVIVILHITILVNLLLVHV